MKEQTKTKGKQVKVTSDGFCWLSCTVPGSLRFAADRCDSDPIHHCCCLLIHVLACSDLTWAGGQDPQPGLGSEGQESLWGRCGGSCRQQLSSAGGACDD